MKTFSAVLLLTAACTAQAADPWPKEMADSVYAHCVSLVESNSTQPAAIADKAQTYCGCLVTNLQGVVSIQEFQQSVSVPPEQFQQMPSSKVIADVVNRCTQ